MNPNTDLDDLELEEEQDEPVVEEAPKTDEKEDPVTEAKDAVIDIIGQNIPDNDLEQSLFKVVEAHFANCTVNPNYNSDNFRVPELNQEIWEAYHAYENFIYQNKFENIDLNELAKILREVVVPKVTQTLWDLTTRQSQES